MNRVGKKTSANALTDAVIKLFNYNGFNLFRVNTGVFTNTQEIRCIRSAPVGTPDIIGISPQGYHVAIEIKVGRDKVSEAQQAYIDKVNATPNGRATVIRNLDEAMEFLKSFE